MAEAALSGAVARRERHDPRHLGPTGAGSVVLDIGGAFGGLVVRTEADAVGLEVEIRRRGDPWAGRHAAVRERVVAGRTFAAALFGPLEEGSYEIRWRDRRGAPGPAVAVRPGAVADAALGRPTSDGGAGRS